MPVSSKDEETVIGRRCSMPSPRLGCTSSHTDFMPSFRGFPAHHRVDLRKDNFLTLYCARLARVCCGGGNGHGPACHGALRIDMTRDAYLAGDTVSSCASEAYQINISIDNKTREGMPIPCGRSDVARVERSPVRVHIAPQTCCPIACSRARVGIGHRCRADWVGFKPNCYVSMFPGENSVSGCVYKNSMHSGTF